MAYQLKPSGTIELSQLADTLAALIEARPDLHEGLALVGRAYGLGVWLPKPRVTIWVEGVDFVAMLPSGKGWMGEEGTYDK